MIQMILPLLKSKTTWVVIAIVAILGYYNIVVWNLERTVEKQEIRISKIEQDYHTCSNNFDETVKVNEENQKTINKCQASIGDLGISYEKIVAKKDGEIWKLKRSIADMKRPIIYPKEIIIKECKLKIKENDETEIDSVLNGLNGIGR